MVKSIEEKLQLVRSNQRITAQAIIEQLFTRPVELHGDRINGDDQALKSIIAEFQAQPVTILAVDRGRSTQERIQKNGGAVRASGYRKALRSLKLAEHFNRPVISFLNMPGADASVESENEAQSKMIADLILAMGQATVPNLAIFLGEGHSGGALAFANANQIAMLENSLFSVASPEAMNAILRSNELQEVVPMTAEKLAEIGVTDVIIPENNDLLENIRQVIMQWLVDFKKLSGEELVIQRNLKFQAVLNRWSDLSD